jgi:hypothetical protein
MNENIKKRNNNSSNDLTIINTSLIKSAKETGDPVKKILKAFKKDKFTCTRDYNIDKILNEKNKKILKLNKRAWSSYNIFFNNKARTSKYSNILLYQHNNFYYGTSIFSAPSVKQNRVEINRLLKNNRNRRLNYINNMHNAMMIKNSKLYRKKINFFSKENSFDNKLKKNLKEKYNINDMNIINNKDKVDNKDNKDIIEKKDILNVLKTTLKQNFRGHLTGKLNKRNFSSYELSLKKYKYLKSNNQINNLSENINYNNSPNRNCCLSFTSLTKKIKNNRKKRKHKKYRNMN